MKTIYDEFVYWYEKVKCTYFGFLMIENVLWSLLLYNKCHSKFNIIKLYNFINLLQWLILMKNQQIW